MPRYALVPAPPADWTDDNAEWADAAGPAESERALAQLRDSVTPVQYAFVEELLHESGARGVVRPAYVARNGNKIRRRLDMLARAYQVNGRIVFPRRPIRHIRFDPLRIRFGRRTELGADPARYYRRFRHVYRGLRRNGLFAVDQSLYQALRSRGQLETVIPETYRRRKPAANRRAKS